MNEEYKPNSHKSKEEQSNPPSEVKKIEPVVKGKVVKKKNTVRKFTDVFVSEDVKNVKSYILMDVLVPAAKKAISDIVTNGIDMILYGESGRNRKRSTADYVSYNRYSSDRRDRDDSYSSTRTRSGYSYDDIVFETRGEAEEVLTRMDELIDTYRVVSVADLYDLANVSGSYTDNNYGWTNICSAEVVRVRNGYIIKLPKVLPIK